MKILRYDDPLVSLAPKAPAIATPHALRYSPTINVNLSVDV